MKEEMMTLYLDDFADKETFIYVCKMLGISLIQNLRCSKTNYKVQEIRFKAEVKFGG